jgi:DNA polymerase III delta subunit
MERAALDEAHAVFVDSIFKFRDGEELTAYLEESQMIPLDGSARAFILWKIKEVPLLPAGEKDLLIIITSGKKKLEDSRAKRSHNFPKLKSFDDNNEVLSFILKEGENRNIDLRRIAGALFVNNGNDLRKIVSEIRKLSILTLPGEVVTPEVARSLMCFSADLTPKSIVDAVCDGHTVKALVFYDRLQEIGEETGWIIAYLHRHVVQQLRMGHLLHSGASDSRCAELLGIHPFIFKKMRENRSGLWSHESLSSSINTLANLDIMHKRGNNFARFGLELEIARLSEESKNVHSRRQ